MIEAIKMEFRKEAFLVFSESSNFGAENKFNKSFNIDLSLIRVSFSYSDSFGSIFMVTSRAFNALPSSWAADGARTMIGGFQKVWPNTWREIWSKLARNQKAPTDFFTELYRVTNEYLLNPVPTKKYERVIYDPTLVRAAPSVTWRAPCGHCLTPLLSIA